MAKKTIDFDVVREIALALPDVEETTIHGAPCFKLRGKLLTCQALETGRAQHACRSNRFRSAREVATSGSERLLRDRPLHKLSDGARALIADRSEIFNRFARLGMGVCKFGD